MTESQPQPNHRPSRVLLAIIYATMLLFGLVENSKGVSFPLIKAEFHAPYDSQGGMVSMTWFGYVIFCLAASLFLHRFGIKKSVLAGYVLVCAGAVATLAAPTFWSAGLALLIVNAGFGFYEVGTNALATVVFTSRAALMMGLMHFFYGLGAILGPKFAGTMIDQMEFTWRQVYLVMIIPTAAVFLVVVFTRFKGRTINENATEAPARINFITALRSPVVWLFCLTLGFMEVIEFGAANWGGLYLQDVYGLDPRTVGASFVSLFYVLFTISRLVSGFAIEKIGYIRSLFIGLLGSILLFFFGFVLGETGIWFLPGTGFFIAIMWPTMMAVGMQVFKDDAPAVTSVIITVSGAINGVFQLVIGFTSQHIGDAWGYRSCLIYGIAALVSMYFLSMRIKTSTANLPIPNLNLQR